MKSLVAAVGQILTCLFLIPVAVFASGKGQIASPLRRRLVQTSSFLEHRFFRFHGGIDFSVGGKKGIPYLAAGDGHIWRVRVSPYGYGKVVYLRLKDGRTVIYAHMSRFTSRIEKLILRKQLQSEQYTVDLYFPGHRHRVKSGEIIGYSGDTGIGVPHLHFEIRDSANRPIDPIKAGLRITDTIDPTLLAIAFIPLDADARAEGRTQPLILPLARYGKLWTTREVPVLSGRIGVALAAWDRAQYSRYRLGLKEMELAVDGTRVFSRAYDRLNFANQRMAIFDRNYDLLMRGLGRYYNLFVEPGNTLSFYDDLTEGSGILECGSTLPRGAHRLTINAGDFKGNTALGAITIMIGEPPAIPSVRINRGPEGIRLNVVAVDSQDFVRVSAAISADSGMTWRPVASFPTDTTELHKRVPIGIDIPNDSVHVRIVAEDTLGIRTGCVIRPADLRSPALVEIEQIWGSSWCEFIVRPSHALEMNPGLDLTWEEPHEVPLRAKEVRPGYYETDVTPGSEWPRDYRLRIFSGPGFPTIVSHWTSQFKVGQPVGLTQDLDPMATAYRGIVKLDRTFPDSGAIRLMAGGFDTTIVIRGHLLGSEGGRYERTDLGASVSIGRGVVSRPVFIRMEPDTLPPLPELIPVSRAVRFLPGDVAFLSDATVTMKLPDSLNLKGVALYGLHAKGAFFLAEANSAFDHTISARVKALPTAGAYRDTTRPKITFHTPRSGRAKRGRRPLIRATVTDHGAGFPKDDRAMEMRIDGSWVPAEYDPETSSFRYAPHLQLKPGRHTVVINARDQVGNEATARRVFRTR